MRQSNEQFSGLFKLNRKKSSCQKDFLNAMKRPSWQQKYINLVEETFRILLLRKYSEKKKKYIYTVHKKVKMRLPGVLKILPFTKIDYEHTLPCKKDIQHKDDEKRFGKCKSFTMYDEKSKIITIRWYIDNGLLMVTHHIDEHNNLVVNLTLIDKHKNKITVTKYYDRIKMDDKNLKEIKKFREFMI